MSTTTHADIENQFAYHQPPTSEVGDRHSRVRDECGTLARTLTELAPRGDELEEALKHVRMAMFWANAAIACNPEGPVYPTEPVDRLGEG